VNKRRRNFLLALASLAAAWPAAAAQVTVTDAWFRALPSGLPDGGYFTLHNADSSAVKLAGAKSPACGMLMLHKSEEKGGMSMMEDVTSIAVPPNGTLAFAPGGYHLMCMSPSASMKPGNHVPVTLDFVGGEKVSVDFVVKIATGK
jgi:copper(I)-binding protein